MFFSRCDVGYKQLHLEYMQFYTLNNQFRHFMPFWSISRNPLSKIKTGKGQWIFQIHIYFSVKKERGGGENTSSYFQTNSPLNPSSC